MTVVPPILLPHFEGRLPMAAVCLLFSSVREGFAEPWARTS
jgi:hypothetical protein